VLPAVSYSDMRCRSVADRKRNIFMFETEYLMKKDGQPKAVVIPIELWEKLLPIPKEDNSFNELSEALEDYCLNRAMNEGRKTPLMNRDEALAYLEVKKCMQLSSEQK